MKVAMKPGAGSIPLVSDEAIPNHKAMKFYETDEIMRM